MHPKPKKSLGQNFLIDENKQTSFSFFNQVYLRHTNFSVESIPLIINNNFKFGEKSVINIEKKGEYFGLKVSGDSMMEAGINDGDTVIIKKTDTAENGKIVVALIDDHEAMLKRLRRKGKTIALESANRNYETKIFGPDRVKVQGVLVSLYRNFH